MSTDADAMIDDLNVLCEEFGCEAGDNRLRWLREKLSALDAAIAAERERCAKIAETYDNHDRVVVWRQAIAAAIRATPTDTRGAG